MRFFAKTCIAIALSITGFFTLSHAGMEWNQWEWWVACYLFMATGAIIWGVTDDV